MANVRISQLPSLSTLQAADIFPVVDTNTTYNITATNVQTFMLSTAGNVTAQMYLANTYTNPKSYQSNVSVLGNVNGFIQGLITLANPCNIYIPDTSTVSVLTSNDGLGSSSSSGGGGGGNTGGGGTTYTNMAVSGYVSATGNLYGANLSVVGTVNGSNLSLSGNVTSNLTITGGVLSVIGNVNVSNTLRAGNVSVSGNVTAGNILSSGNVSFTGNITTNTAVNFNTIGFAFQQLNGNLYLTYNGANIISFNNNGTIIAANNITAYGTLT
jgi:hypothetical protein